MYDSEAYQKCGSVDYRELGDFGGCGAPAVQGSLQGDSGSSRELAVKKFVESIPAAARLNLEAEHDFVDGLYLRTLAMPPESVVVGKRHKLDHLFMVLKGSVTFADEMGVYTAFAGESFPVFAPCRRVLHAGPQGCVIMTVHPNPDNELDVRTLEARLVE